MVGRLVGVGHVRLRVGQEGGREDRRHDQQGDRSPGRVGRHQCPRRLAVLLQGGMAERLRLPHVALPGVADPRRGADDPRVRGVEPQSDRGGGLEGAHLMARELHTPIGTAPVLPVMIMGMGAYLTWFGVHYWRSDTAWPSDPVKAVLTGKPIPVPDRSADEAAIKGIVTSAQATAAATAAGAAGGGL